MKKTISIATSADWTVKALVTLMTISVIACSADHQTKARLKPLDEKTAGAVPPVDLLASLKLSEDKTFTNSELHYDFEKNNWKYTGTRLSIDKTSAESAAVVGTIKLSAADSLALWAKLKVNDGSVKLENGTDMPDVRVKGGRNVKCVAQLKTKTDNNDVTTNSTEVSCELSLEPKTAGMIDVVADTDRLDKEVLENKSKITEGEKQYIGDNLAIKAGSDAATLVLVGEDARALYTIMGAESIGSVSADGKTQLGEKVGLNVNCLMSVGIAEGESKFKCVLDMNGDVGSILQAIAQTTAAEFKTAEEAQSATVTQPQADTSGAAKASETEQTGAELTNGPFRSEVK